MLDDNKYRRTVLKSLGAAGAGLTIGGLGTMTVAGASACADPAPNNTWSASASKENAKGKNEGIYLATTAGCIGAEFDSDFDVWRYKFKQQSVARSEKYPSGDHLNALNLQQAAVNKGTCNNIAAYTGDCYVGARPQEPGDGDSNFDYTDVAYEVAKAVISELSTKADYAITASELVGSYMEADGGTEKTTYEIDLEWTYGINVYEELSNYVFFEAWADDNEYDYFDIITMVSSYWDNEPEIQMSFELYEGYSPQLVNVSTLSLSGATMETTSSGDETRDENGQNWNIEKIPPEKIRRANREGRISVHLTSVEKHERRQEPLYWAHTPPVKLRETKVNGEVV